MPVTLAEIGSFHVPGRVVTVEGEPTRRIQFTADASLEHDPNGRYAVEQMYAQYFLPVEPSLALPLVLMHGGGLTGAMWETTPDGRPGWLTRFLEAGFPVYVVDNMERGRSGFCALPGVWEGEPIQRTDREAWSLFRFGLDADFDSRTPRPGQRFPLDAFEVFMRQFVPRWLTTTPAQIAAFERVLERIGRCVVLCHSQGGHVAQTVAARRPDLVAACIGMEPSGFPEVSGLDLNGQRWLLAMGDFLGDFPLWTGLEAKSRGFIEAAAAAGAEAEFVSLPEIGFPGATHMMTMDEHSDAIAAWVISWVRRYFAKHQD